MTSNAHVVAFAAMAWGHTKPLLILLARMAEYRTVSELTLTILTGEPMLTKVLNELALMPKSIADRVNVINIGASATILDPQVGFNPVFADLWSGKPVVKVGSNESLVLSKPSVVIIDPVNGFAIPVIKDTSGGACPIVSWYCIPMSSLLFLAGPEHLGGMGDLAAKIEAAAQESGKTPMDVADDIYHKYEGNLHPIPGVPAMYDYDFFPQEYRNTLACDGVIAATASAFESQSIEAARAWFSSMGKDTFVVGPLEDVPASTSSVHESAGTKKSQEDAQILAFLDDMHAKYGARSLIYIAFGTIFYPKDSSKLEAALDEIIASGTPVLWGHASPFAVIPKSLEDKFASAPNAFHAIWTPQRKVLSHPATGWYIAHGGWNGVQEALSLRVPMIMWPFAGDQPSNAALLGTTHKAAFELHSVRTGKATRQPRRLDGKEPVDFSLDGVRQEVQDLLVKLKGPEGVEVRNNSEKLGAAMAASWSKGGEANLQVEAFLNKYARA